MSLSYGELEGVVADLQSLLPASIQQVYVPSSHELFLELRANRKNCHLLISVQDGFSRLHLTASRSPNPPSPQAFQMVCRKFLRGRVQSLTLAPTDRVIEVALEGSVRLVLELFHRKGNVFLLDAEGLLLGMLRSTSSGPRKLAIGSPYLPPMVSPALEEPSGRFSSGSDLHQAIAGYYSAAIREQDVLKWRIDRLRVLAREEHKLARRLEHLKGDQKRAQFGLRARHFADLLQTFLDQVPLRASSIDLPDVFSEDAALISIPLEPALGPVKNMQRYYRLHHKYADSLEFIEKRMQESASGLERIRLERVRITEASSAILEVGLAQEPLDPSRPAAPSKMRNIPKRLPFFRYATDRGQEIWVGRGGEDNATLTFRLAKGNDTWLHVRGRPGAHVVLPLRGQTPDFQLLQLAAGLAMRHSRFREGDTAEVAVTQVKYVRRLVKGAPGTVTFSQDRSLWVELSADLVAAVHRADEAKDV